MEKNMLLPLYRALMRLSTPALEVYLRRRARAGREDPARAGERRGRSMLPRGDRPVIWCHAASVGESLSLLPLLPRLMAAAPSARVLVTTGTVTSARLMAARLPAGVVHQYVPVDHPVWVARFLDHWRPSFALWTESELWPNMLSALRARSVPAVLLNARMSEASFNRWRRAGGFIRDVLSAFDLCLAQNAAEATRLTALGAANVAVSGNLKYAADPLPHDAAALQALQADIKTRPVVLWASTHADEEKTAALTHRRMAQDLPDILTVIVPRHPQRGADIAAALRGEGLSVARRAAGALLQEKTEVYLADTLGELGLFFRLCPLVVMGGTFADVGGHNPIEPAQLGCAVVCGPQMYNFTTILDDFRQKDAIITVEDADALPAALLRALADPAALAAQGRAAAAVTAARAGVVDTVMQAVTPVLQRALDNPQEDGGRKA